MMRIVWNGRSWRWFESASAYTQYSHQMAELLLERIPQRGTLCDIGCGAALILRQMDAQEITPMSGGQMWDLSTFGFAMRVPEDAVIADHTRENAALGGILER